MNNKILFISEALCAPFDEGTKKVAFSLCKAWEKKKNVISVTKAGCNTGDLIVKGIDFNKLFLSNKLRTFVKTYSPDIVLYLPQNSCSFYSFLRIKILKLINRKKKIIMLAVQHVDFSFLQNFLLGFLKPDLLLVLCKTDVDFFCKKGIKVKILPPAVDCAIFCPPTKEEKDNLRAEYNIPVNKKVVLHAGHIKASRNLECFIEIQKITDVQVIIVGSTSTRVDNDLKDRLVKAGIIVIDKFVPDISRIYKLSDTYVFPVVMNNAAIDIPLSVLEALACNLQVITTRFGGLVDYFQEGEGFRYFQTTKELISLIGDIGETISNNKEKIMHFTWDRFAEEVFNICEAEI